MPRSRQVRDDSAHSTLHSEVTENEFAREEPDTKTTRIASVYDAVAGRVGLNGFLSPSQMVSAGLMPSTPEEVLLRRVSAPDEIPHDFYNFDEKRKSDQQLPDSDLLKGVHVYASDFFTATTAERGQIDFRTFDGTALLTLGILLEEASKEALGANGDLALTEPEGLENGLPESNLTKYQIIGRVKPRKVQQRDPSPEASDDLASVHSPRKKRKA